MLGLHRGGPKAAAALLVAAMMIAASATSVAAAPPTYALGSLNVSVGSGFDIDLGHKAGCDAGTGADLCYWNAGGDSTSTLGPVDSGGRIGAKIKKMGSTKPTYWTCKDAKVGWREYSRTRIPAGTWFCAKTDEGRVSRFRIPTITNSSIKVVFRTWSLPS